jgi:hypothetical protein
MELDYQSLQPREYSTPAMFLNNSSPSVNFGRSPREEERDESEEEISFWRIERQKKLVTAAPSTGITTVATSDQEFLEAIPRKMMKMKSNPGSSCTLKRAMFLTSYRQLGSFVW